MSLRNIIDDMLVESDVFGGEVMDPSDHIWSAGALTDDTPPSRPFISVRFGVAQRGMGAVDQVLVEFWVHDDQGDYTRVDLIQGRIRGIMDGAEHVSEEGGSAELIRAEFQTKSGDLYDPGFRTIARSSSYRLTGTGA